MTEKFSHYTEEQKKELIEYLKDYQITYRDQLNLNKKTKFGIEIEAEGEELKRQLEEEKIIIPGLLFQHEEYFKQRKSTSYNYETCPWILKPDTTVKQGAEIHSPILQDTKETWLDLQEICEFLQTTKSIPTDNTAIHTHIDPELYIEDIYDLYNLIKTYSVYEKVLYYFGMGEFSNFRKRLKTYAKPVANEFQKAFQKTYPRYSDYKKAINKLPFTYNTGLRLTNLNPKLSSKTTIEFRFANGTIKPEIIQNLINAEAKLCDYTISNNFDDDFITRKFKDMTFPQNPKGILRLYSSVSLEEILEFVDLIFTDEIDKLNFIKQCIQTKTNPKIKKKIKTKLP